MTDNDAALILIADDEDDLLDLVTYNLHQEGYRTAVARDGRQAFDLALENPPDMIVLDVMMPNMDGLETCRRFRAHASLRTVPILMLTARTEDDDQVRGLDHGADIYLTKPVSVPVLLSQVRALLRTAARAQNPPDLLNVHNLEINRDRYVVFQKSNGASVELRLPRKEFELLHFLASHPGKVYSRQELLDQVWGTDVYVVDRTVDVHVRKIREKLGNEYVETVKGIGYRFLK